LLEGKPIPDTNIYWKLIEKYKAKSIFTFPTALRVIRKADPYGVNKLNYNLESL